VIAAVLLFSSLKQQFFPAAERDQFAIEVWMPTETRIEQTASAIGRIEELLSHDCRVANYASFIGSSAPRFYYNYAPEPPVSDFGQILVSTHESRQAEELAHELLARVDAVVPEGRPHIRVMQQGPAVIAPVEVRIIGNAIILVDYANELVAGGADIRTAAAEAGKRRLRPIFLTAMAAAIGVLPMILSGSSLWSPLASVIAVGVIYSMMMTLLVVPVLYTWLVRPPSAAARACEAGP